MSSVIMLPAWTQVYLQCFKKNEKKNPEKFFKIAKFDA